MDRVMFDIHVVPLPGVSAERFETVARDDVLPATLLGPTRAGEVHGGALYRAPDGHYHLMVPVDTMSHTEWAWGRLGAALDAIEAVGIVVAREERHLVATAGTASEGRVAGPGG